MRKLKLQMQISVDGFVGGPNGELDWMIWDHDDKIIDQINELIDTSDTILMGRKMTDGFVNYWTGVLDNPDSPDAETVKKAVGEVSFARKMVDTPKIVFSRTLSESQWVNTTIESDLISTVNKLKHADGKDLLVYGGAGFVTSLIKNDLIDDYYLFENPAAIGNGMTIFGSTGGTKRLKLIDSTPYECGVVVNHYQPA